MSYLIRRVLAEPRLILDEMCRLYGKFASYLRRVLCKTRLIFPRINGPNVAYKFLEQVHVTGAKGGKLVQVTITFDVNPDRPIECRKIFFSQSKSIAIQKQSDRKIC